MRQRFPDGSVWVRTEPITFLHDRTGAPHHHDWHQLTFALRGHLEVESDDARALVPPDGAVFVPAGVVHRETHFAPVAVRTLYLAAGALPRQARATRTLAVSPLLRELIVHATGEGALDRKRREHAHVIDVIVDQLARAPDVSLRLPTPRDPRARRIAEIIRAAPGDRATLAQLSRRAGASLRTLERAFLADTAMGLGEWRRRVRLFHALHLLERGASVTAASIEAGYATPSAFSVAFSKQFGAPPARREPAQARGASAQPR